MRLAEVGVLELMNQFVQFRGISRVRCLARLHGEDENFMKLFQFISLLFTGDWIHP